MTKQYFTELASYNNWTDDIIIGWLKQISEDQWEQAVESSFSSIQLTAIHMVSAKKIWIDFWTKKPAPVYLSTVFNGTKDELIAIWQKASDDLKRFVENYPEEDYKLPVTVFYPNGKEAKMEFWKTLPHFVNHATYHRGQLVTILRHAGFTNFTNTDLFTYFILQN